MSWIKSNYRYAICSFILATAFFTVYQFFDSSDFIVEIISLTVFIAYLIISAYFKLDFRIPVFTAILLLIFCAITLSLGFINLANQGAIIAYYYLAVGVLGLFINYLREHNSPK
ncbi:MAG: hypothetical protein ACTSSJ_07440 [Candidatus Odinarchaeia archaeon]